MGHSVGDLSLFCDVCGLSWGSSELETEGKILFLYS